MIAGVVARRAAPSSAVGCCDPIDPIILRNHRPRAIPSDRPRGAGSSIFPSLGIGLISSRIDSSSAARRDLRAGVGPSPRALLRPWSSPPTLRGALPRDPNRVSVGVLLTVRDRVLRGVAHESSLLMSTSRRWDRPRLRLSCEVHVGDKISIAVSEATSVEVEVHHLLILRDLHLHRCARPRLHQDER